MIKEILLAIIAIIPTTLAVIVTRKGTKEQLTEIHANTNSNLQEALAKISRLEAKLVELKQGK